MRTAFPEARFASEPDPPRLPEARISPPTFQPLVSRTGPDERVLFVVSDQTRKTGLARYLPVLLEAWENAGLPLDRIRFLVACGSHRPPTKSELEQILGISVYERFRGSIDVHVAGRSPVVFLGTTRRGTPVDLSRIAVEEADAVIACGAVLFHYFAGFAGGPKSILPGLASLRTISANHSLSLDLDAATFAAGVEPGNIHGNPVWEDIAEGAAYLPVRGAVQTVLDRAGRIVCCAVGTLGQAHVAAVETARRAYAWTLEEPADVVVASALGAPNWVQAHKALVNAHRAVRPDGVVLLVADCPEGIGSDSIRRRLRAGSPRAIADGLRKSPDVNGQTALSTLLRGRRAVLLTGPDGLSPADAALLRMPVVHSPADAVRICRERLAREPRLILPMPDARVTVPMLSSMPGGR